ncbi:MAG: hypothetical protein ACXU8N_08670 [Telluria sp.]
MTRDRRGFRYPLEPVRALTGWKIDELVLHLAEHNLRVDQQERAVGTLQGGLAAAQAQVVAQRQAQALLDIDAQRFAHAYLVQVQARLAAARTELDTLVAARDTVLASLAEARRYADSLDRDRAAEAADFDRAAARKAFLDADDHWMQRQHWRNTPDDTH